MSVIVRFAPSPTGFIHLGNARVALLNWLFAKKHKGKFMFRLDDTDLIRSKQEYTDCLYQDLEWLGLSYDIFAKQSDRFDRYESIKKELIKSGRLYPCYDTEEELAIKRKLQLSMKKPPVYDRSALKLSEETRKKLESEGKRPHWRFFLKNEATHWKDMIKGNITVQSSSLSDPVLIKEDGTFLYTITSAIDDMDFEITHIIRGEDHVTNTAVQIQLFEALSEIFPKYRQKITFAHLALLTDKEGNPLSKRLDSFCIKKLRETGYDPMAINCFLAGLGSSVAPLITDDLEALVERFDFNTIRGGAKADEENLKLIQKKLLHTMDYIKATKLWEKYNINLNEQEWKIIRESLSDFSEVIFWDEVLHKKDLLFNNLLNTNDLDYLKIVSKFIPTCINEQTLEDWFTNIKEKTGRQGREMIHPIRIILTGKDNGPEIKKLLRIINYDIIKFRLQN